MSPKPTGECSLTRGRTVEMPPHCRAAGRCAVSETPDAKTLALHAGEIILLHAALRRLLDAADHVAPDLGWRRELTAARAQAAAVLAGAPREETP